MISRPTPTNRAYIDTGRICSIRCMFCYHKYVPYTGYKTLSELTKEIDDSYYRGNNYIDFTGGEPTLMPPLEQSIFYLNSLGMRCCVISCGVVNEKRLDKLLSVGVDDWLMSVHGVGECHDVLTGGSGHFKQLLRSMEKIREKTSFRFNVVMNRFNITDLPKIANLAVEFGVRIVNFINFNPHNVWKEHTVECGNIIANLREVEPVLNEIIPYLEDNNVGVNVRYYPMCRIKEEYRRTISNDLHVLFDPYEWDYGTLPKTFDTFMRRAVDLSHCNEESNEPCNNCQLKNICGGINKHFNSITRRGLVDKVTDFEGDTEDFYWYRKYNWRTLHER